jgi:DNA replication protein DnaC
LLWINNRQWLCSVLLITCTKKSSFIVATNKSPEEWVNLLDDEVIATALLARILYHCEVIRLSGKSYRFENRKTIFEKQNQQKQTDVL